jgi:hypothetical protein
MAGENNPVETRVGQEPVRSLELGMPLPQGQDKPQVQSKNSVGHTAEFDADGVTVHESDKDPLSKGGQGGQEAQDAPQGEGGDEAGGEAQALPKFDPANHEVLSQYEAAYINPDTGEPNVDALAQSWFKNASKDASGNWSGSLSDDDYAFLETKGYSKSMVKQIEAGQVALLQQKESQIYSRAGGPDRLQQALDWARKGGYSDEQKGRYNQIVVQGADETAKLEQIDLLMQRWGAATGNGRRPGPRTQTSPRRTVAANAGASGASVGGAKPYANYAEYQADLRKARAENNQSLLDESRKRLKASPWYTGAPA